MTHYTHTYTHLSPQAADDKALKDMIDYLGQSRFDLLIEATKDPSLTINGLNMLLGFAGVSGYPFHAFARRHMLTRYREWMATDDGDGLTIATDAAGFPTKELEANS